LLLLISNQAENRPGINLAAGGPRQAPDRACQGSRVVPPYGVGESRTHRIDHLVTDLLNRLLAYVGELRRRRVLRVAAGYLVAGWVVVEVTATTFPLLGLPGWAATFVLVLVLCGLPVALALAWAYDITPEGVKRAEPGRACAMSQGTLR
jgi:hypothetical protein